MITANNAREEAEKFWDKVKSYKINCFETNYPETVSSIDALIKNAISKGVKCCFIKIPLSKINSKISLCSYLEIMGYKVKFVSGYYAPSGKEIYREAVLHWD